MLLNNITVFGTKAQTEPIDMKTWRHKDRDILFSMKPTKIKESHVWDNTVNQEDVKCSHIILMLVSATH